MQSRPIEITSSIGFKCVGYYVDVNQVDEIKSENIILPSNLGTLHRLDGPAVIWEDGDKEYWVNGKLHRLDGPAMELHSLDTFLWFVNGIRIRDEKENLLRFWWNYKNEIYKI